MNWLKNFVRPRFPSVFRDHDDTPDNLWQSCKQCGEMIFHRDLALLQQVCPGCDHHMRVGARERFAQRIDRRMESAATSSVAGKGVHSSNAMVMVASRRYWISVDRSGVSR